jgi:hypothetical protein
MTIQNIFNLAGLIINMVGAYMMYHYTPKVVSQTYLFTDSEQNKMREQDVKNNKMIRLGMLLLFIGFIFQFVAFFINI